jgi:hypothetical protein
MTLYLMGISPLPVSGLLAMVCAGLVALAAVGLLVCFRQKSTAERLLMLSVITGVAAAVQAVLALILMGR